MDAAGEPGVDDVIDDGEIINRLAILLAIEVGTAPLEVGRAVSGRHQVMGTEVDFTSMQFSQLQ